MRLNLLTEANKRVLTIIFVYSYIGTLKIELIKN